MNRENTSDTVQSNRVTSNCNKKRQVLKNITNTTDVLNEKKRKVFPQFFKEKVVNTKKFFMNEEQYKKKANEATATCLKISKASVKRIYKEYNTHGFVGDPKIYNSGRQKKVFDSFEQGIVRQIIFDMYMRKEYPTITKILNTLVTEVDNFPTVSEYMLRDCLKTMNFKFKKYNKKPILMESAVIAGQRSEFLSKINNYRKLEYKIFYTDETWCGANHSKSHGWVQDISENCVIDNYDHYRSGVQSVNGQRGGFVTPSGAES